MSIKVNIYETKTHLSKLINRAIEGEEIVIAKSGEPVARLVSINKKNKDRKPGIFKGKIKYSDDIDRPLPDKATEDFYK
ncbi:MAG: type II toxin-antitoxin system Phd/YefM family antitoxin [Spirochaetota bacterium]